jgi:hypothetical protein
MPSKRVEKKDRKRAEKNKRVNIGIQNRIQGLCSKANKFNDLFGGDILLVLRPANGAYIGYQTRQGLLQDASHAPGLQMLMPQDVNEPLHKAIAKNFKLSPSLEPQDSSLSSQTSSSRSSSLSPKNMGSSLDDSALTPPDWSLYDPSPAPESPSDAPDVDTLVPTNKRASRQHSKELELLNHTPPRDSITRLTTHQRGEILELLLGF